MKSQATSRVLHLLFFVVVEIFFVFIIFRERPEANLFTLIGIGHLIYRAILLWAGYIRTRATTVMTKFLSTYTPIVFHLLLHVYIWAETLHAHAEDHGHDHAHEWEMLWIVLWVIWAWVLIYIGETLLHRKTHCDTHHADAHANCHDGECVEKHVSN